jgi:hypothetical protein
MPKAKKVKQLNFDMSDRPGLLAEITAALTQAKVNIGAICAYAMDNRAFFMILVDSNAKARKALAALKVPFSEEDVISVEIPNTIGSLEKVAKKISDAGINIYFMYGTAGACKNAMCVFSTSDDKKAQKVIR